MVLQIKPLAPMKLARVYANGCALPDGKVFITGGADTPKEFSDAFAHDQPGMDPWPVDLHVHGLS